MKFRVKLLPRADADINHMARYIAERSRQGAAAWLTALEGAISRLAEQADGCSQALEADEFDIDVRQQLFKTRRGLVYRLVFTIVDNEVRILRVRGPGQVPVEPGDVDRT